jgi:hypothetical protein
MYHSIGSWYHHVSRAMPVNTATPPLPLIRHPNVSFIASVRVQRTIHQENKPQAGRKTKRMMTKATISLSDMVALGGSGCMLALGL